MKLIILWTATLVALASDASHGQQAARIRTVHSTIESQESIKSSHPFTVQFVLVEKDIKLEVVDWGGTGRPLVFLSGLGDTSHTFDNFAPKLAAHCHVFGITRRGFGNSSAPAPVGGNYSADRLGDDVLAVVDKLNLHLPVLVGHSIAGEELSSIGSRHPEKVSGLIYLDAGYSYAFYDQSRGDLQIDSNDLRQKFDALPGIGPLALKPLIKEILETNMPQLERDLLNQRKKLQAFPDIPPRGAYQLSPVVRAIFEGERKYTDIQTPVLAFFAVPHDYDLSKENPAARAAAEANDLADTTAQANAFEAGIHSARVVRLPRANHYVFQSNEEEVLREMQVFLNQLTHE